MHSHQFLQAFFFFAAPSPQMGALRDNGSGFFKSSSSRRASVSTRSWPRKNKQRKTQSAWRAARALVWFVKVNLNLPRRHHQCRWLTTTTFWRCWDPGRVSLLRSEWLQMLVKFFEGVFGATQICKICKKPKKQNCDYISPGLGVFFPKDSLIWLDDPTS